MRRLYTIVLVGAAAIAVTVLSGGSAYAGGTETQLISPASPTYQDTQNFQDDLTTGCGSHRAKADVAPALAG